MNEQQPIGQRDWLDGFMPAGQGTPIQSPPRLLSMAAIRGILFRQRFLISGVIIAALIIGLAVTMLTTPMYRASSTVQISPYGNFIVEGQDVEQGVGANQIYDLMVTQVGVLTSRDLASKVADDLNLAERADFLGEDVAQNRPANVSDERWRAIKHDIATGILQGSVSAEVPLEGWIIAISYTSREPAIAAEMANAYSAAFVAAESSDTLESNRYAQQYLSEQINITRGRLQQAEQAANAYARSNAIVLESTAAEGGETGGTLTTSYLASISDRTSAARAARIQAEQRWRAVQNVPASQLTEYQANGLLQGLLANRTTKSIELAQQRGRYTDDFPQILNLQEQIAAIDQQIQRTSSDIKSAVRNDFIVARNQEQALQAELSTATTATLGEQDRRVDYGVLDREAEALRNQLAALLSRYNQVMTATDIQAGVINPLDSAMVPTGPYSPNLLNNMALALVLGIALGSALAVLREIFDDRVRSLDDIEERLGLRLLGHTPYVADKDMNEEISNRSGALIESYASIKTTIDFSLPRDCNVIQLTSSRASEGKSTTSLMLAELFAISGRKTLLIDADLRRPAIASLLHLKKSNPGIVEVLLGQADLQSAIVKGSSDNLDILPVCELPANPAEVLASERMKDFIAKYRKAYSLIIIDSSPVLGLADAPSLSRLVDGTIFVMEANGVHFGEVRAALQRLRASGGNPIGAVLTKYRALASGDGYSYKYSYYQYGKERAA